MTHDYLVLRMLHILQRGPVRLFNTGGYADMDGPSVYGSVRVFVVSRTWVKARELLASVIPGASPSVELPHQHVGDWDRVIFPHDADAVHPEPVCLYFHSGAGVDLTLGASDPVSPLVVSSVGISVESLRAEWSPVVRL